MFDEMNATDIDEWTLNESWTVDIFTTPSYPLDYRIIATLVHVVIFIIGVCGNIVVILVVYRNKFLQSPTYTYLVSLAYADLMVLLSAVPEAVLVHHIGNQWIMGQVGCSVFIFANFLGINAGGMSILAFTLEQYVAFCGEKQWMQRISSHSNRVVWCLWMFTILYCVPWLGLTVVRPDLDFPHLSQCELRLSPQQYLGLFGTDFVLFYLVPLMAALFCYTKIAVLLLRLPYRKPYKSTSHRLSYSDYIAISVRPASRIKGTVPEIEKPAGQHAQLQANPARAQVIRMLIVVVMVFAVAWLPFRGLLIFNSFASEPWLDQWFLFFAKTLIYLNSAINPYLYNIMSPRFRIAVHRLINCGRKGVHSGTDHSRTSNRQNTALMPEDWITTAD